MSKLHCVLPFWPMPCADAGPRLRLGYLTSTGAVSRVPPRGRLREPLKVSSLGAVTSGTSAFVSDAARRDRPEAQKKPTWFGTTKVLNHVGLLDNWPPDGLAGLPFV